MPLVISFYLCTSDNCSTNDNHSGKFIQMCDLEILLQRMAVSVVVTFLPSMTLAWENHVSLRPSFICHPPASATCQTDSVWAGCPPLSCPHVCCSSETHPQSFSSAVLIPAFNLELRLQGLGNLAVEGWYFPLWGLRTSRVRVSTAGSLMWPLVGAAQAQAACPGLSTGLSLLRHKELVTTLTPGLGPDSISIGACFCIMNHWMFKETKSVFLLSYFHIYISDSFNIVFWYLTKDKFNSDRFNIHSTILPQILR